MTTCLVYSVVHFKTTIISCFTAELNFVSITETLFYAISLYCIKCYINNVDLIKINICLCLLLMNSNDACLNTQKKCPELLRPPTDLIGGNLSAILLNINIITKNY